MLPHETELVTTLWPHVRDAYNKAEAVHDFVVASFFNTPLKATSVEGLNELTKTTVLGLLTKLCKTHRALELASVNGLGQDAMTLARSMYEAAMLAVFILQSDSKERSAMYITYMFEQQYKMICKWEERPDLSRIAPRDIADIKRDLETQLALWRPRCGGKDVRRHWSGESSLERAAGLMEEDNSYQALYRFMSPHAHGGDLLSHIQPSASGPQEAKLLPSPDLTVDALHLSTMFLWTVASRTDEGCGLGMKDRLDRFKPNESG